MRYTTAKFAHGDTPIIVTKTGQFEAKTAQGLVTRSTLSQLRKALDSITPFKQFVALAWRWDSRTGKHGIRKVTITGTSGKGGKRQWRGSDYSSYQDVWVSTPANKKSIRAWVAVKRQGDRERDLSWKREAAAKALIEKLIP